MSDQYLFPHRLTRRDFLRAAAGTAAGLAAGGTLSARDKAGTARIGTGPWTYTLDDAKKILKAQKLELGEHMTAEMRAILHAAGLPAPGGRGLRRLAQARAGAEADCDDPGHRASDDRHGAPRRHPARRGEPASLRRRHTVSRGGDSRRSTRPPAAM